MSSKEIANAKKECFMKRFNSKPTRGCLEKSDHVYVIGDQALALPIELG